jgi:6-phosphogluconolactonase
MLFNTLSHRLTICSAITLMFLQMGTAIAESNRAGVVYVMTNQAAANSIIVFQRNESGRLRKVQEVPTGGLGSGGTGDPLGSQGSLILSGDGRLLFAVNAGSNELSLLAVTEDGLRLIDKVPSGGTQPVSIAVHRDLVFVLNAGGSPNITGFFLTPFGRLRKIAHGSQVLPSGSNAGPGEVLFSPDGESLLVTEKTTGQVDIFHLTSEGRINDVTSRPSNGATPFGFAFASGNTMVVTEAAGGATGASSVSSYRINDDGDDAALSTVSGSLANGQTATCWIAITRNKRLAFTANAGSGTISSFVVTRGGRLGLLAPVAANLGPGFGPTDLDLSADDKFLYALSTNTGAVAGFEVREGNLKQVEQIEGLPLSIQGIAVR